MTPTLLEREDHCTNLSPVTQLMKENGREDSVTVKASRDGLTVLNTKVTGRTIVPMVEASSPILMEMSTKATG
jgi:hypothetical protein